MPVVKFIKEKKEIEVPEGANLRQEAIKAGVNTYQGLNGIGAGLITAIFQRDYLVVQGTVVIIAVTFVVANFLVDALYAVLDPRIRHVRAVA